MKRFFILDDSPEFIFLIESLFKLKGMDLDSESVTTAALEKIKSNTYDLLIIDYLLEDSNGLEVIRSVREIHGYSDTPIILLTAKKLESEELQQIKDAGVLFLPKPIQPTEFYNKVRGLIGG